MTRLNTIAPETAVGTAKELLATVKSKMGMVPNLTRVMANSPAVLEAYLHFSGALAKGKLEAGVRERIALVTGQTNSCDYCLAAHSAIGKMAGLSADEIQAGRRGASGDPKIDTLVRFAKLLVENRGVVSDADLDVVKAAGYDDGDIAEVVGNVALNIFTNYFNHVAGTEIDFPKAPALS